MGATLYSLVTGKVPWDGSGSVIGVQVAVRSEPLRFPEEPRLTSNLCDLITKMLTKDPNMRMNLSELKEHPWLTLQGTEPLPSTDENCQRPVIVTDEEIECVITRAPKLNTLILIKTMLKQHSFQVNNMLICELNLRFQKIILTACIEEKCLNLWFSLESILE